MGYGINTGGTGAIAGQAANKAKPAAKNDEAKILARIYELVSDSIDFLNKNQHNKAYNSIFKAEILSHRSKTLSRNLLGQTELGTKLVGVLIDIKYKVNLFDLFENEDGFSFLELEENIFENEAKEAALKNGVVENRLAWEHEDFKDKVIDETQKEKRKTIKSLQIILEELAPYAPKSGSKTTKAEENLEKAREKFKQGAGSGPENAMEQGNIRRAKPGAPSFDEQMKQIRAIKTKEAKEAKAKDGKAKEKGLPEKIETDVRIKAAEKK